MTTKKALQKFDPAKLKDALRLSPTEAVEFLENFRVLAASGGKRGKSKLISIKIPEALLVAFKSRAQSLDRPYQSLIKELMWEWLRK
jgi:predicted DNA binding CopG/RHH family protein